MFAALKGHEIEVKNYRPGLAINDAGKDLVILSGGGGEGLEITDKVTRGKLWYQDEIDFVRNSNTPILGICMGFEVIVKAFGGKVHYRPELTYGFRTTHLTPAGQKTLKQKVISQVEAHYWYVPEVPENELETLAVSESGIEIVRHTKKNILGTQFHPEEGGTLKLPQLLTI